MFALKLFVCGMLLAQVLSINRCESDKQCSFWEFCDTFFHTCEPKYNKHTPQRREAVAPYDGVMARRFEGIRNRRDV